MSNWTDFAEVPMDITFKSNHCLPHSVLLPIEENTQQYDIDISYVIYNVIEDISTEAFFNDIAMIEVDLDAISI